MSLAEIEQAIRALPEEEKKTLLLHLAEDIEDAWDAKEMEKAIQEGDPMPYEEFRKDLFKDKQS